MSLFIDTIYHVSANKSKDKLIFRETINNLPDCLMTLWIGLLYAGSSSNSVAASKNSFGIDGFACKSPGTVLSLKS